MSRLKEVLAALFLAGTVSATVITLGFLIYSLWLMPTTINNQAITVAPNTQFYVCNDSSISSTYCQMFAINVSTATNNATLNVTWQEGNNTNCVVKFIDQDLFELKDFSYNTVYQLPNTYAAGTTFGLKITRKNKYASNCNFTIEEIPQ